MKLFQQLLVATASLGLISPIVAEASELLNIEGMNSYARSKSSTKKRKKFSSKFFSNDLATFEKKVESSDFNQFEAGSFSDTTTMSGSVSFQIGSVDDGDVTEAVTSTYAFNMDMNSSFTGDDNLYVGIETGNASGVNFLTDSSINGSDILSVASMYYQFPIGNYDLAVGPKLDNDDLMPTTISTYSDKFFMSGYGLTDSNWWLYGNTTGFGLAISRSFDNGFNVSGSLIGTSASTSSGLLTDEGIDVITLSAGYDGDNYGGGIVFVDGDDYCGLVNSWLSTSCSTLGVATIQTDVVGIGGYWNTNEGKTSISATTNIITPMVTGIDIDPISDLQIGIDQEIWNGVLSASWKTIALYNVVTSTHFQEDTLGSYYEVYFTQPVNDSLELMYGITVAEPDNDTGDSFELFDYTAVGAQATFKF